MSQSKHATISAWQREEDGSYAAEINGWALHVKWKPEVPGERRGFYWEAQKDEAKLGPSELFEEIELAMVAAETAAAPPNAS